MNEIKTISGLPNDKKVLPSFFRPICQVRSPFYKSCFMDEYGRYCAMRGCSATLCTDAVRTVLVKNEKGEALMYAYAFEWPKDYALREIGEMQVYEVKKDQISLEDVIYHRLPFADSKKGMVIMVRDDKNEGYVEELWLRDAENKEETKLDFLGGSLKEGMEYLRKEKLI